MDHFSDTLDRFQRWKQNLKSENIGGMAGMVGNLLVGCQLDPLSLGATAAFVTASGVFTAVGDKAWGYSTGAALVTAGCVMMACSPAAMANKALQTSLGSGPINQGISNFTSL